MSAEACGIRWPIVAEVILAFNADVSVKSHTTPELFSFPLQSAYVIAVRPGHLATLKRGLSYQENDSSGCRASILYISTCVSTFHDIICYLFQVMIKLIVKVDTVATQFRKRQHKCLYR
jgi:hypothetical protein